ncbi:MAG TPA: hypothetical protein VI522_02380, partial [Gammaproteobacteria bacterium]|nr:hypothetical protein [Gammaproteobacteria bacterium]
MSGKGKGKGKGKEKQKQPNQTSNYHGLGSQGAGPNDGFSIDFSSEEPAITPAPLPPQLATFYGLAWAVNRFGYSIGDMFNDNWGIYTAPSENFIKYMRELL